MSLSPDSELILLSAKLWFGINDSAASAWNDFSVPKYWASFQMHTFVIGFTSTPVHPCRTRSSGADVCPTQGWGQTLA